MCLLDSDTDLLLLISLTKKKKNGTMFDILPKDTIDI